MEIEVGGTGSWGRKRKWGVEILLGGGPSFGRRSSILEVLWGSRNPISPPPPLTWGESETGKGVVAGNRKC